MVKAIIGCIFIAMAGFIFRAGATDLTAVLSRLSSLEENTGSVALTTRVATLEDATGSAALTTRIATLEDFTGSTPLITRLNALEDYTGSANLSSPQSQSIGALGYQNQVYLIALDTGTSTGSVTTVQRGLAAERFNGDDANPAHRYVINQLPGYVSGSNVTYRTYFSLTGAVQIPDQNAMRWTLDWSFLADGDTLGANYDNTETQDFIISGQGLNTIQHFDFTLSGAAYDNSKPTLALRIGRASTHGNDTYGGDVFVHKTEMIYLGWGISNDATAGS